MGQIVFQATLGGQVAVAGPNTASSYTLTLPAATDTLVGKATTDTLTNKTLTSPTITGATLTTSAFNGTVGATTASTGAFTTLSTSSTTTLSGLTASTALALDASKNVVSVTNTGTGNNVLSASPTLTGTIAGASLSLSSLTSGRITYAGTAGLLQDSSNLTFDGNGNLSVTGTGNSVFTLTGSAGVSKFSFVSAAGTQFISSGVGGSNNMVFAINNTETMRLTSTGLGIGTSSPTEKLSIVGADNSGIPLLAVRANNLTIGTALTQSGVSVLGTNTDIDISVSTKGAGNVWLGAATAQTGIRMRAADDSNTIYFGNRTVGITADSGNTITIGQTSSATTGLIVNTTSGNVGIGTSSPTALLHAYISSSAELKFQNSSQNNLYVSGTNATVVVDATGSSYPGFIVKTQGVINGQIGGSGSTASGISITNSAGNGLRINSNGDGQFSDSISVGDATPATSGSGITFPATVSVSSNANTLDDYEEGTWTPTLTFGGGTTGITYSAGYNTASYTKIGSRVFVSGITILTNKGSSTGNAYLSSLPFPADGVNAFTAVACSLANITFTGQYAMELDANADFVYFFQTSTLGVQTNLTNTNFSNTSQIIFNFSYFTSS